jgi:hypothetical protein
MVTETEQPKTYRIACEDCGVVKVYHTPIGIRYFEDMHFGHRVTLKDQEKAEEAKIIEVAENLPSSIVETPPRVITVNPKRVELDSRAAELEAVAQQEKVVENLQKLLEQHTKMEQVAAPVNVSPSPPVSVSVTSPVTAPTPPVAVPIQVPTEVSVVQVEEETKEDATVLLAKDAFIKEGEKYRQESVRISQSLKEFRWKIQPPYVISILFDDSLGIQSTTGTISRELLSKVENLGYQFVAVEAPEGVPTAWFRKGVVAANVDLS